MSSPGPNGGITLQQAQSMTKAELEAIASVLRIKVRNMELLTQAETLIAEGNMAGALSSFLEVQRNEFQLVVAALTEKKGAMEKQLAQLSSRVIVPGVLKNPGRA